MRNSHGADHASRCYRRVGGDELSLHNGRIDFQSREPRTIPILLGRWDDISVVELRRRLAFLGYLWNIHRDRTGKVDAKPLACFADV